ncbi:hypothetical protein FRC11_004982 [Ceratobasidium sp. 423]|nr:hypothetical protein FRC11_004982 [Ceratobasidium sp. 423]
MVHSQGNPEQGIAPVYEGAFSVLGEVYHILTRDNYIRTRGPLDFHPDGLAGVDELDGGLVIFRDSDVEKPPITESHMCSHDGLGFNSDDDHPVLQAGKRQPEVEYGAPWYDPFGLLEPIPKMGMLGKRDDVAGSNSTSNFVDQIGNTSGCSKTQKLVYMGVAADCEYTSRYGGTQNATTMILNDWNTASSLYKTTFNMSLGIVELAMQDPSCPPSSPTPNPAWNTPCTDSITLNDRLSLFSAWRGERGGSSGSGAGDSAGLWHLMSGCPTGTEVGVAWLGQLCNTKSSGSQGNVVSGTAVSTAGRTEWQVVAHEIGHNFGAIHDCIVLNANLVDGSPCGYGGTCNAGNCQAGSALDTAKAWYTSNLQISIPVTVVVGIIVLLILWGCLRCIGRCCGFGRNKGKQRISSWVPPEYNRGNATAWNGAAGGPRAPPSSHQPNQQRHSRAARSWNAPPTPGLGVSVPPRGQSAGPESRESTGSGDGHAKLIRARSHWVDDAMYNGPNYRG